MQPRFSSTDSSGWRQERNEEEDLEDADKGSNQGHQETSWNSAFEQRPQDQAKRPSDFSRRIHILGVGNIGLLIAHSLAGIPNRPPITFLTRTRDSIRNFRFAGSCVELITNGISEVRSGFEAEHLFEGAVDGFTAEHPPTDRHEMVAIHGSITLETSKGALSDEATSGAQHDPVPESSESIDWEPTEDDVGDSLAGESLEDESLYARHHQNMNYVAVGSDVDNESIISNLIVSLKAKDIRAISRVAHRLTKDSAILFVQNGMGYIEEVNEKIFPDPETRPTYLIGVVTHGAKRLKAYTLEHAGFGTIQLTILPRKPSEIGLPAAPTARYLLRTIARTPVLAAVQYSNTDLLQRQLEKLAVNCVINPITAMMDCPNGEILNNYHISRTMRMVLAEVSLVIQSLPELQNVPNVQSRFDPGKLELVTVAVASSTAENISSMLSDVRNGKETEIDYINGWIIRRGEELGIRCIINYMLMQMLKAKQNMIYSRDFARLPLESEDSLKLNTAR